MRSAWAPTALGLALACASAGSQPSANERSAPRATAAAPAAAAPTPAVPETVPTPSRPLTAAEAAEKAHEEWGGADDAPCATDADCTLTRIAPGSCCASLCSPRAVTRARAKELEQRGAECRGCIEPLCRDPGRVAAACRAGRCVATKVASPD